MVEVASSSAASEVGEMRPLRSVRVKPDFASMVRRCLMLVVMVCLCGMD